MAEPTTNKSGVKYMVDVAIPPACLEDGDCEHNHKPDKKEQNPV